MCEALFQSDEFRPTAIDETAGILHCLPDRVPRRWIDVGHEKVAQIHIHLHRLGCPIGVADAMFEVVMTIVRRMELDALLQRNLHWDRFEEPDSSHLAVPRIIVAFDLVDDVLHNTPIMAAAYSLSN